MDMFYAVNSKFLIIRASQVEFIWEIRFAIIPVPMGNSIFAEGFRTRESVTYLDGWQLFFLQEHVSSNQ